MYSKKYIIGPNVTATYEWHAIVTEVSFDGDHFHICQIDKDTGHSKEMTLSERDAADLRGIIQEVLEQGE